MPNVSRLHGNGGERATDALSLNDIVDAMHAFVEDRGWYAPESLRPQTPRNLATSLAIECGELLECFQWSDAPKLSQVGDEIADIVLYAAQLAGILQLDLEKAVRTKLVRNQERSWDGQQVTQLPVSAGD